MTIFLGVVTTLIFAGLAVILFATGSSIQDVGDVFQLVSSAATLVALVVGASWAYTKFVKGREDATQGLISLEQLKSVDINDNERLLKVVFQFKNTGKVAIYPWWAYGSVWPVVEKSATAYRESYGEMYPSDEPLQRRDITYHGSRWILEPGEAEPIALDFIVSRDVPAVRLHIMAYGEPGAPDEHLILSHPDRGHATYAAWQRAVGAALSTDDEATKRLQGDDRWLKAVDGFLEKHDGWETVRLVELPVDLGTTR